MKGRSWIRRPSGLWTPEGIYAPARFLTGIPSRRLGMSRTYQGVSSEAGGGTGLKAGGSYPYITFYWGCESTTAEKSGGDTTASALGGSESISSTQKAVGTYSVSLPTANDGYIYTASTGLVDHISGRIGMYLYIDSVAAGSQSKFFWVHYNSDTDRIWGRINYASASTGTLQWDYKSGNTEAYIGASATLNVDTWYFVELSWNLVDTNPNLAAYVNGVASGTSSGPVAAWTSAPTTFLVGDYENNGDNVYYVDQVIISNDPTKDLNALKDLTSFPD